MGSLWIRIHRFLDRLSLPSNESRVRRYGFVIILSLVFFFVKSTLAALLGKDVPFLFSLFVVILSAWYGGLRPGIFATALTGFITYFFFLEPKYTILGTDNIPKMFILLTFFIEGGFISVLSESHRKSDVQKNEFIGVISHELKNPLTSIKGYVGLLKRLAQKNTEPKIADYANRIDMQTSHVVEMINEMLDVSKIETGHLTYHDETFNITDLVKEIVSDQQVTTTTHKIEFAERSDIWVYGDRYRIGQVITNLISNAVKYSPQAKKVVVHLQKKRSGIVVSVRDFGPGIAKEDQVKLFEPFFRAENTKSAKGTGIGLYISSQIVGRHKGKLWVKSTPRKGSTFYLQLSTK